MIETYDNLIIKVVEVSEDGLLDGRELSSDGFGDAIEFHAEDFTAVI